ncbi:hypothetical protein FRC14_008151 [Serendipita sp. 396]|nr:hypothetical protein FRC14_008151 [Serendipita sp. 396]KAG8786756.1 hypothetical protein FRC15_010760 [Serendipita sp. 397]KAG8870592.1 hypothetical protein FRC20_011594 [Serendipita sp. 405]
MRIKQLLQDLGRKLPELSKWRDSESWHQRRFKGPNTERATANHPSTSRLEQILMPEKLSADDCAAIVMGFSGSGKSKFIPQANSSEGHGPINQMPPKTTFGRAVITTCSTNKGRSLVDTPGIVESGYIE